MEKKHIDMHTHEYRLDKVEENTLYENPKLGIFHPNNKNSMVYYKVIELQFYGLKIWMSEVIYNEKPMVT